MKRSFSNRQPYVYRSYTSFRQQAPVPQSKRRLPLKFVVILVLVIMIGGSGAYALVHRTKPSAPATVATSGSHTTSSSSGKSAPAASPAVNYCAGNTLSELVLVSISKQHLWVCEDATVKYDSAVVTGMEKYAADLTPPGTYHIYSKQTNIHLKGCDPTGCWDDPVSYWMPWLSNQYGIYGFHDATWRKPSQFGHVDIYAPETAPVVGSHGCVELPLATAKWIYDWSHVGTTVKVVS